MHPQVGQPRQRLQAQRHSPSASLMVQHTVIKRMTWRANINSKNGKGTGATRISIARMFSDKGSNE